MRAPESTGARHRILREPGLIRQPDGQGVLHQFGVVGDDKSTNCDGHQQHGKGKDPGHQRHDADGDGLVNVLEYVLVSDALNSGSVPAVNASVENIGGTDYLTLTYTRRVDATDAAFAVEVSTETDEFTAAMLGWPVRTFESTVPPGKLGWGWAKFAFGSWTTLSWVDENVWRHVVPKGWFYNVMLTGVKPS